MPEAKAGLAEAAAEQSVQKRAQFPIWKMLAADANRATLLENELDLGAQAAKVAGPNAGTGSGGQLSADMKMLPRMASIVSKAWTDAGGRDGRRRTGRTWADGTGDDARGRTRWTWTNVDGRDGRDETWTEEEIYDIGKSNKSLFCHQFGFRFVNQNIPKT